MSEKIIFYKVLDVAACNDGSKKYFSGFLNYRRPGHPGIEEYARPGSFTHANQKDDGIYPPLCVFAALDRAIAFAKKECGPQAVIFSCVGRPSINNDERLHIVLKNGREHYAYVCEGTVLVDSVRLIKLIWRQPKKRAEGR